MSLNVHDIPFYSTATGAYQYIMIHDLSPSQDGDKTTTLISVDELRTLIGGGGSEPVFTSAWQVRQPGNPNQANGYNVTVGLKIEKFLKDIFEKATPPTYTAPTASISTTPANDTFEMGTILNLTINGGFTKNDGGNATAHRILKNGAVLANTNTATDTIQLNSGSSFMYRYQADYLQGPVKNDDMGNPSPTNQIPAGVATSGMITFTGTLKRFFGPQISGFTNYRTLSSVFDNTSNIFIVQSGTTYKDFYILLPASRTLTEVKDLDALNAIITSSFVMTTVQIADVGGALQNYKLYKMANAVPYAINHRLQVTIS